HDQRESAAREGTDGEPENELSGEPRFLPGRSDTTADACHSCSRAVEWGAPVADRTACAGSAMGSSHATDGARRLGPLPWTAAQRRGDPLRTLYRGDIHAGTALCRSTR